MKWTTDKSQFFAFIFAPPLMATILWAAWPTDIARKIENVTIDWRFDARASSDPAPDPKILLIGIGEQSLESLGRWQDWTRNIHADFLEALTFQPPAVIAFDLFFTEPARDEEEDLAFADALSLHPSAITGMYLDTSVEAREQSKLHSYPSITLYATKPFPNVTGDVTQLLTGPTAQTPVELIAQSSWTGSVNFPPSRIDGMRRKAPLLVRVGKDVYPSLVLQIVMQLEDASRNDVEIRLGEVITVPKKSGGEWKIPIDRAGNLYVNYRDTRRLPVFDFSRVTASILRNVEGEPWPDRLPTIENKILIIGQSAEGLSDFGPTPYRPEDALFSIQATVLDSILREDYLYQMPQATAMGLWLLIAWGTVIALRKAPFTVAIGVPIAITVSIVAGAFFLFYHQSILIPLALPVIGFIVMHTTIIGDRLASEFRRNQYIKGVFGSYVSPEIVNQIIDSGETPELGGEKVDITVLFSDIEGFSTFSEELEPEELVDLMVEYLSALTDVLTDKGGCLDKYIGDAIDAMFGAPLPMEDHAYAGVVSTIEMQRKQSELRKRWKEQGRADLIQNMHTRIGLNSGPAVVGNMGSRRRFNYTMMGDNVNLGARCESGAKAYGIYTMITEATYLAAKATQDDVVYRFLDQIIVKGRTLPVKMYEVIETVEVVSEETKDCLSIYAEGMSAYLSMDWDKAIEFFEKSSTLERFQPEQDNGVSTNPSRVMIARCGAMKTSPPPANWDGVFRMTEK